MSAKSPCHCSFTKMLHDYFLLILNCYPAKQDRSNCGDGKENCVVKEAVLITKWSVITVGLLCITATCQNYSARTEEDPQGSS